MVGKWDMIIPSKYFLRFPLTRLAFFFFFFKGKIGLLGKYLDSETAADGRIFSTRCIF